MGKGEKSMPKLKIFSGVILTLVVALGLLYPSLPKAYFYSVVREVYTKYLVWQTSDWHTKETPVAKIRYGLADSAAVDIVAANATSAINVINKDLNFTQKDKTLIIIYPDSLTLARSFGWDSDAGAMGVYYGGVIRLLSPRVWVSPKDGQTFAEVFDKEGPILHEYVHLVVDSKTNGNYERWFTEGLAQYYENKFLHNINNDPIIKEPLPLSEMGVKFDYQEDQEWAYAQSYLMTKYLMDSYGSPKMSLFMKNLGSGTEFTQAFKQTYSITLDQFYAKFLKTLNNNAVAI